MKSYIYILLLTLCSPLIIHAQNEAYSLDACIDYALEHSTDISRTQNNVSLQEAYVEQSKAARLPNLQLSDSHSISSSGSYSSTDDSWSRSNSSSLSTSLSSQMSLYNGAKLKNNILKYQTQLSAVQMDMQTEKELISLDILSAYIDVMLNKDNVTNTELQLESTQEQWRYADAKHSAGTLNLSDLLNIKSELASNKTSVVQAKNSYKMALITLMQLMNMPVKNDFNIVYISVEELISNNIEYDATSVYNTALGLQPSIKSAELGIESAETDIKIAKADALPSLSLNGSLSSGYTMDYYDTGLGEQYSNKVNPSLGLSLSVPIFQQKKVKTQITIAQIEIENSRLALTDEQNNLRKYIEQACTDALLAQSNYEALKEQLAAEKESYELYAEMFKQGMINSVDLLSSKNDLIMAENEYTQAKYTLIHQNKIVEYYMGQAITL